MDINLKIYRRLDPKCIDPELLVLLDSYSLLLFGDSLHFLQKVFAKDFNSYRQKLFPISDENERIRITKTQDG